MGDARLKAVFDRMSRSTQSAVSTLESEKNTEIYLVKLVKSLGGRSFKWSSPQNKGVPDRICVFPNDVKLFVEVKSEGETLTGIQELVHQQLRQLTTQIYVVATKREVDTLFDQLSKGGTI